MPRTVIAVVLAVAALTFAACGGDDDDDSGSSAATTQSTETTTTTESTSASSSGGGGETLSLAADPGGALKFDKTELKAKAGKVTINFTNDSSVPHAVELEGNGVEDKATDTITQSKASLSVDLKPGTYTFYCPVGNHESAGMKGTLTVS